MGVCVEQVQDPVKKKSFWKIVVHNGGVCGILNNDINFHASLKKNKSLCESCTCWSTKKSHTKKKKRQNIQKTTKGNKHWG